MLSEILNKLSGGHITAIAMTAMLVPGAAVAAVAYQAVAIVDPTTGAKSSVDASRRLSVYDPVAGYGNQPGNKVEITISNNGSKCETNYQYTIPSGKALVITAISGLEQQYSVSLNYAGYSLFSGPGCTGNLLSYHYSSVTSSAQNVPISVALGSGIVVKPGSTLSVFSSNNFGFTFLHGYLVPAGAVPAAGTAEAVDEPISITAAEVAAKMAKSGHR